MVHSFLWSTSLHDSATALLSEHCAGILFVENNFDIPQWLCNCHDHSPGQCVDADLCTKPSPKQCSFIVYWTPRNCLWLHFVRSWYIFYLISMSGQAYSDINIIINKCICRFYQYAIRVFICWPEYSVFSRNLEPRFNLYSIQRMTPTFCQQKEQNWKVVMYDTEWSLHWWTTQWLAHHKMKYSDRCFFWCQQQRKLVNSSPPSAAYMRE